MTTVKIIDDDHIWVSGKQYVSLRRFFEARSEVDKEHLQLCKQVEDLKKENAALLTLLEAKGL